jgi:hypothetical protein
MHYTLWTGSIKHVGRLEDYPTPDAPVPGGAVPGTAQPVYFAGAGGPPIQLLVTE